MHVSIYRIGQLNEADLKFVVICVKYKSHWLLVRHKDRVTWEMAGGHIDIGESAQAAALRELYEETGIIKEAIEAICDYEVCNDGSPSYGRLFYANAEELGELPDYEIAQVRLFDDFPVNSTYPEIYDTLITQIKAYENNRDISLG
jgi:8-oxo-dGTP diphosphatase